MLDSTTSSFTRTDPIVVAGLLIAALGALTILGALFFEYGLALRPCPLCLEQRIPYYVSIPIAVLAALGAWRGAPRWVLISALVVIVLLMLWGAGMGVYHSGVEWKWWAGPQDCSAPLTKVGGDLLKQLQSIRIVRCDEASWRFLGLSLAGYNVLIALALAAIALWGIAAKRKAHGSSSVSQYR